MNLLRNYLYIEPNDYYDSKVLYSVHISNDLSAMSPTLYICLTEAINDFYELSVSQEPSTISVS
jgi:hypothetical protein